LFLGSAPVRPDPVPPPSASTSVRVTRPPVVWIPAGRFQRGTREDELLDIVELCLRTVGALRAAATCQPEYFRGETPAQEVHVGAFGIDRTEVTVVAYRRCVAAGRCTPSDISAEDERLALPDHPVTGVDFRQASSYCDFVGGRLPTEAEWERAARGHDRRIFPWGRHWNDRLANGGGVLGGLDELGVPVDGYRFAAPAGAFADGASPYGLLDMAGNALEWTSDLYADDTYATSTSVDPTGASSGALRVVRGGSWRMPGFMLRTANRMHTGDGHTAPDLGFRCAYDPP
jgi:formylglycine-generating enzyme required for sulfatase activity